MSHTLYMKGDPSILIEMCVNDSDTCSDFIVLVFNRTIKRGS
jgi:hypothetical protein